MLHRVVLSSCLTVALALAGALSIPAAHADPIAVRGLSVAGSGVTSYPAFDPGTTRYAATTDETTGGTLTLTATTSDPDGTVLVNGRVATGPTHVSGLAAGDEVSVIIDDAAGRTPYSVIYLPAGFPRLNVTTKQSGLADGYIGMTLGTYEQNPLPSFDTIIDRNGVPVWAIPAIGADLDLRQQPNGDITISRLTVAPGKTGHSLVTLDDQLLEKTRQDVVAPLTNTDPHDSIKMVDGSTVLTGYEYDADRGVTDATIQKLDADGEEIFRWSSAGMEAETTANAQAQGASGDYAHINSVVSVEDGDLIASFRHFSSVLRIATVAHDGYEPGDIIWKLGGRDSTFSFVDDPYGGPCAQHTAEELPNGNIVLYDNGSSGLCVDQAGPEGPTVARGATRVAEYALDLQAGTATLVWSYAPAGAYAWFAGSSRRLANGNTLIGWADERDALATEVDADKQVLWEVDTLPATPGHRPYMTYRAELITSLGDAIDPVVTPSGPADGATFVQGAVIGKVSAGCSDRGGANLSTCTVSPANGVLDTSTPGTRSWTVTAADGAGNTTTVTRQYTVRAPVRRSDGWVRKASVAAWTGVGSYGTAERQTVTHTARRGVATTSYWNVRNTGERADTFRLTGTAGTRSFAVRYFSGGREITAAVLAGTYRTSVLAPGASQQVRVLTKALRVRNPAASRTFTLRSASLVTGLGVDRVAVRLLARR